MPVGDCAKTDFLINGLRRKKKYPYDDLDEYGLSNMILNKPKIKYGTSTLNLSPEDINMLNIKDKTNDKTNDIINQNVNHSDIFSKASDDASTIGTINTGIGIVVKAPTYPQTAIDVGKTFGFINDYSKADQALMKTFGQGTSIWKDA
ncbi:hypothetical protein FACS189472_18150 [Alphaproteobacteria bacterium]|nr:hypothetical protein FACS189472_18150 [Alphaproteobacteria bacterium]